MSVTIKNAKVTYSNMRNRITPELLSREFCIELPCKSEEITKLREQFKELETKAKSAFSEQEGKKVKGASTERGLGSYLFDDENEYRPGFVRLKFTVFNFNEKEVKNDDGSTKKVRVERLNPIYKNLDFCYKIDNNGKKEYTIPNKDIHWLPLSENIIDIKCSLVASYNKSDNRVTIKLKADDVNIIQASEFRKSGGGYLTLEDEDEEIQSEVEKSEVVQEDEMFDVSDLEALNV
jgi:hypothetical protein